MRDREPNPHYLLFILVLSLFTLVALAVGTLVRLPPGTKTILLYADHAVCALFFADFLITLARSEHRGRYLLRWGWLDLLSSLPMVEALRWGRATRILRIVRVLRGMRSTKVLASFLLQRRAQSAFLVASLVSVLLVVLSAIAVLQFEVSPEANIRTPEDALWWAVVTMTTVGYGDRFPISSEGRVVAALLMAGGVGMFGTFSGFVAAWFLHPGEERRQSEIEVLTEEVRRLHNLLEPGRGDGEG